MTPTPENILAIKLAGLGDLLLCEPALRSLRCAYPTAAIDVLLPPMTSDLLSMFNGHYNPVVFDKALFDSLSSITVRSGAIGAFKLFTRLRANNYGLVVLFHHLTTVAGVYKYKALLRAIGCKNTVGLDNGRGNFLASTVVDAGFGFIHETDYMLKIAKLAGGKEVNPDPVVIADPGVSKPVLPDHYVAIYPVTGAYSSARNWPVSYFAELVSRLTVEGLSVVIVGDADAISPGNEISKKVPSAVNLAGKTTIHELAVVLQGAKVAIGADTFAGHLATAVNTPAISLFGPSNYHAWRPYGSEVFDGTQTDTTKGLVVTENLPCSPCLYSGYYLGRPSGCPDRTCMKNISVSSVFNATMIAVRSRV